MSETVDVDVEVTWLLPDGTTEAFPASMTLGLAEQQEPPERWFEWAVEHNLGDFPDELDGAVLRGVMIVGVGPSR